VPLWKEGQRNATLADIAPVGPDNPPPQPYARRQAARLRRRVGGPESIAETLAPVSAPRERNILGAQNSAVRPHLCQVDNYIVANPGQSASHQSAPVLLHAAPPPSLLVADPVCPRDHASTSTTNSRNCDVFSFATHEPRPSVPHLISSLRPPLRDGEPRHTAHQRKCS
jgi:hypothetical protein